MSHPLYPDVSFRIKVSPSAISPPLAQLHLSPSNKTMNHELNQVKEILDCCSATMTNNLSTSTPMQHNTSVDGVNAILLYISPWGSPIRGNCLFAYLRPKTSRMVRS